MGVGKGGLVAGERDRIATQLLWLIGLAGLVTREQLLRLVDANPKSCSTFDRALAKLTGRFTGHRRGPLGPWREVRPGLQCPVCRGATVVAVQVNARDGGLRVAYGHGAAGSAPREFAICKTKIDHAQATAVREHVDRYLLQRLPPSLVEHRPGRVDGYSYLRATDAGREHLVALRRDRGQAPIPLPCWSSDDHWATTADLAVAEFAVELLAASGYARMPWLLPARVNSPGPRLAWTSGEEDHALSGDEATVGRHLSVHTEVRLPSRRLLLFPVASVMGRDEWTRQDFRLVKAAFALLCRLHRQPAPGCPSTYRRTYKDGLEARGILLVPERERERLGDFVRTLRPPPWALDRFGFAVHSADSLVDYVCGHLGLARRPREPEPA